MVDIGGVNLPRSISTKMGAKLARLYKDRGVPSNIIPALKQMYTVLNTDPTIESLDDLSYRIYVKHPKKFCPIGGKHHPDNVELFQDNVCLPFTLGFLTEVNSEYKYKMDMEECIVGNNGKVCQYCLSMTKKD